MVVFDADYYRRIWGTVHRHDYVDSLADVLVRQHGKVRILDIGTGCGALVKALRERGCDAWGLEVSEHALANSCCPDFVRRGDIRSIPFAADSFDVVHSQGVWAYLSEQDIPKAWKECQRVGKIQHHNIDYLGAGLGEEEFVTAQTPEWWKDQFYPRILVACPNHIIKAYAFQRWIDNVKSFTYPNYDVLVIDNSPNAELWERYCDQVPIVDARDCDQLHHDLRITQAMAKLQRIFLAGPYWKWFNVESDVIPPKDVIEQMLRYGQDADWISHAYPLRNGVNEEDVQQGIGCSLLSRRLFERFDFVHAGDNAPDGWLWGQVRPCGEFKTMEMWGFFKVKHLHGPGGDEYKAAILRGA